MYPNSDKGALRKTRSFPDLKNKSAFKLNVNTNMLKMNAVIRKGLGK